MYVIVETVKSESLIVLILGPYSTDSAAHLDCHFLDAMYSHERGTKFEVRPLDRATEHFDFQFLRGNPYGTTQS